VTDEKNKSHRIDNTSGYPNITFDDKKYPHRPWLVRVFVKGAYVTRERFAELQDAIDHRDAARLQHNLSPI
jgi:hypothetical protein